MKRALSFNNTLHSDDIKEFKKSYQYAKNMDLLRDKYLKEEKDVPSSCNFVSGTTSIVADLLKSLSHLDISDSRWLETINKIVLLGT
jgi:hypothetical protein